MKTGAAEGCAGIGGCDGNDACAGFAERAKTGETDAEGAAGAVKMSEKLSGRDWSFSCFFWMERAIQKIPMKDRRRSAMPAIRYASLNSSMSAQPPAPRAQFENEARVGQLDLALVHGLFDRDVLVFRKVDGFFGA